MWDSGLILYIVAAFLLSVVCGFIIIPQILFFCKRKGLYDHPDFRKVHKMDIPRLGGISFMPSMLLAFFFIIILYNWNVTSQQMVISPWSAAFFISLLLIYGVGIVDDLVGLGPKTKFVFQTLAATMLPLSGLYVKSLYGFCGINEIPYYIGIPITVFFIIYACNAINLIDGIDGLSAGLSFIALMGFLFCFMREGAFSYCILIASLAGVLIPFLYFNIFGNTQKNQKIFMGDSGSLTLGYTLGFLFVKYTMDTPATGEIKPDSMLLAYTLLIVPMFDVVRVSLVRLLHHTPIFKADNNHIHHKLMRAGFTQHQALICILALAIFFIVLNILLGIFAPFTTIVAIDVILWMIFHIVLDHKIKRKKRPVFMSPETSRTS